MNRIVLGKKIVKKEGKIVTGIVPGKKTVKKKAYPYDENSQKE